MSSGVGAVIGAGAGLLLGWLAAGLGAASPLGLAVGLALALGVAGYLLAERPAGQAHRRQLTAEVERLSRVNANITEAMAEGLTLEDADGRLTLVNPTLLKLLDYEADELLGQPWSRIVAPASRELVAQQTAQRAGGASSSYEARLLAKDGYEIPMLISAMPIQRGGQYAGTVAVLVNIAERLRAENALQRANEYLSQSLAELQQRARERQLISELNDQLQVCITVDEAQAHIAQMLPRLFAAGAGGLYLIEAGGRAHLSVTWGESQPWAAAFPADECWGLRRGRAYVASAGQPERICRHWPPLDEAAGAAALCLPLVAQGEALGLLCLPLPAAEAAGADPGPLQRLAQTVADSLALALANLQLRDTLRQQSIRDPLTGMFNRRYMEESLERELRRSARRGYPVGIIMLDIDHFKNFNDTFGHAAGDLLLRTVGDFLSVHIRAGDVACRYGGEEFVLILPEATLEITSQRAEHLREEIRHLNPEYRAQRLGPVTASAGVAAYPANGQTAERLLRAVDEALYQAKRQGRDRVVAAQAAVAVD